MAKEELIQFEGLVTEILPDARYRVQLDAGQRLDPVLLHLARGVGNNLVPDRSCRCARERACALFKKSCTSGLFWTP